MSKRIETSNENVTFHRKYSSGKQKVNESKGNAELSNNRSRDELDFIADGGGTKSSKGEKKKRKEGLFASKSTKTSKKMNKKSVSSPILVPLLRPALEGIDQFVADRESQLNRVREDTDSSNSKLKDISYLEKMIDSLKCQRDMLSFACNNGNTGDDSFTTLLGSFLIVVKEIRGLPRSKTGDQYEVFILHGAKKWHTRGIVKTPSEMKWAKSECEIKSVVYDSITIKVIEVKRFGKSLNIGEVKLLVKNLFVAEHIMELDLSASSKLVLEVTWSPLDLEDIPVNLRNQPCVKNAVVDPVIRNDQNVDEPQPVVQMSRVTENFESGEIMIGHEKEEMAFFEMMRENARAAFGPKKAQEVEEPAPVEIEESQEGSIETWVELVVMATVLNCALDDYRGRYPDLRKLETTVISILENYSEYVDRIRDGITIEDFMFEPVDFNDIDKAVDIATENARKNFCNMKTELGNTLIHQALITHLKYCLHYLQDVGSFGPLIVKEIVALHRLKKQADILELLLTSELKAELELDDFPVLLKRRTLVELWRSCCDGVDHLCVNARILCMELESEFGREVRRKHPDVANIVFPELVNRILGRDVANMEDYSVTIFQLLLYAEELLADEHLEDMAKAIDKLALEMFLTTTLKSDNESLILTAIKRVGSLLALRTSNLQAISHLLMSKEETIRTSSGAHIRHISSETSLCDKALVSFVELLQSSSKKDRQCACIALGLLEAKPCIPLLSYVFHADTEMDVRESAAQALECFGEEGQLALQHAERTLVSQTSTQRANSKMGLRLGTAF